MKYSLPSVSVVIPALDAAQVLEDTLKLIDNQDYPNVVEVIVAAGDPDTRDAAARHGATVVENPSGRTPTALNLGIAKAQGDVVVRCDAQSKLPKRYISRAVETMLRTRAINVGGMQIPVGETFWEKAIAAAMSSRYGAGDARYRTGGEEGPVETVYLGVFDREQILELGGFDEDFTRNQDYELNHRIIKSGGVVWFDPELKVEYRPRGSLRDLWKQYFEYGQAKRLFARRHPRGLRLRQMAPPVLVITLATTFLAALFRPIVLLIPAWYLAALVLGTLTMPRELGANPGTIAALATMHLAWGVGFLIG